MITCKNFIFCLLIFIGIILGGENVYSQSPNWLWAKSAGGTGTDIGFGTTTDNIGNIYVTGYFSSPTITFGTYTFNNATNNGNFDMFIVKYNSSGDVVWAKSAGGNGAEGGERVITDDLGNVYVVGYFMSDSISFDTTVLYYNPDGMFIVKYDSFGNVIWAKSARGFPSDITKDGNGNIYIAGCHNLSNNAISIAKYNSTGNVIWETSAIGAGNIDDQSSSVSIDNSGNLYLTGDFWSDSITFGTNILYNSGESDIFIAKFDSTGSVIWVRSAGGAGTEIGETLAINDSGYIYNTGTFWSPTITFGTNVITNNNGAGCAYIVKYNLSGDAIWSKCVGSYGPYNAMVSLDSTGNIYLIGYFMEDSVTFGTTSLFGMGDIYIAKFDPNLNILWAKSVGGSDIDVCYYSNQDLAGNFYLTGQYTSPSIVFGNTTLVNSGQEDVFVAKLSLITGIEQNQIDNSNSIYPNPPKDNIIIEAPPESILEISNIRGQIIKRLRVKDNKTKLDISNFSSGVYIIRIQTYIGITTDKFLKE